MVSMLSQDSFGSEAAPGAILQLEHELVAICEAAPHRPSPRPAHHGALLELAHPVLAQGSALKNAGLLGSPRRVPECE